MVSPTTPVNFSGPLGLAAALNPDAAAKLQVQNQQVARAQAIAQALRQQGADDTKVDPGSRVSWTQGLARLAQTLAGNYVQSKADKESLSSARTQGQMLSSMLGLGSSSSQTPAAQPDQQAAEIKGNDAANAVPSTPTDKVSNVPSDVTPTPIPQSSSPQQGVPQQLGAALGGGQPAPSAPVAMPAPAQAPVDQSQSLFPDLPGQSHPISMYQAITSPDTYFPALNASHAPTDFQKTMSAYQAAVSSGDTATADGLHSQLMKMSAIEMRPGATALVGDKRIFNPNIDAGYTPTLDAQGNVTGETPLAGHSEAVQSNAAASAAGTRGVEAQYNLTPTYNQKTGQMDYHTQAQVAHAAGGETPYASGPGIGTVAGANADATSGVQAYANEARAAADIPNQRAQIQRIQALSAALPGTGAGAIGINDAKSRINTVLQAAGFSPYFDQNGIANTHSFIKEAAGLANTLAAKAGGNHGSSDARLASAYAALPDPEKAPGAIAHITNIMGTQANMVQARAQAFDAYGQKHGETQTSWNAFNNAWNKTADFDLFERIGASKTNPAALTQGLSKTDAASMLRKYRTLKAMGAF